jgi:hypothetical protein
MFRKRTPAAAVDEIAAAFDARDRERLEQATRRLIEAVQQATLEEIQPAVVRLASFVDRLAYGPGGDLGQLVGSMAGMGTGPWPVLPILVERACAAMEDAARFAQTYRELFDEDPPSTADEDAIPDTIERFTAAV